MKKYWWIVALAIVVIGIVVFISFTGETEEVTGKVASEESFEANEEEVRPLYVVTSPWKPYMYEDDNGEYAGLAVDLLDRIMTELDVPYTFELFPWTRALEMVKVGEADVAAVATYNDDRATFIDFTPEQIRYGLEGGEIPETALVTGQYVFFARKFLIDSIRFESVDKIIEAGYRIGVSQDYTYDFLLEDDPRLNTIEFIDHKEAMQSLSEGEVDFFVVERLVGISTAKDLGLEDELAYFELNTNKALFPQYLMFGKESNYPNKEQLIKDVDRVILELKRSGEYDEIYKRYTE